MEIRRVLAALAQETRPALFRLLVPTRASGLAVDDDRLLAAMALHPLPVNRPIVCTAKGVRLCRPGRSTRRMARF
jgi:arsenate reductase